VGVGYQTGSGHPEKGETWERETEEEGKRGRVLSRQTQGTKRDRQKWKKRFREEDRVHGWQAFQGIRRN
jgi:hypothetical protein